MIKKLFVLREPRCGGSMLSAFIVHSYFQKHNLPIESRYYTDSHDFTLLEREVINCESPFVIRINRRNLTEHMLSKMAIEIVDNQFTNLTPEQPQSILWDRIKISKVEVTTGDVESYIASKITLELKILSYIKDFNIPYHEVWYEDAMNVFDIPQLELYNLDVKKNGAGTTFQLPEYKRNVFTNYDQVPKWMRKYKDAYIKKHNLEKLLEYWTSHTSC